MNVPETYSELQEAVAHLTDEDGEESCANPDCEALLEVCEAADKLARNSDDDAVDAALQACRECYGSATSKDELLSLLSDNWCVYSDVEEYAQSMADNMCVEIPDFVKYHVDWESLGRELLQDTDVYTFFNNQLHIFHG